MLTTLEQIQYLLPNGSRCSGSINKFPCWPLDLFAVVANLINLADGYRYLVQMNVPKSVSVTGKRVAKDARRLGVVFRQKPDLRTWRKRDLDVIQTHWKKLVTPNQLVVQAPDEDLAVDSWIWSALFLLVVADEACGDLGFYDYDDPHIPWISRVWSALGDGEFRNAFTMLLGRPDWYRSYVGYLNEKNPDFRNATSTGCIAVPADRACVLPKALVTPVGCTLRSLSKHLSLHPGVSQVESTWHDYTPLAHKGFNNLATLNVLVVPYPFELSASSFRTQSRDDFHTFSLTQSWLNAQPPADIVQSLVERAIAEGRRPDIVILPELALDEVNYKKVEGVIKAFADERRLILIAGVSMKEPNGSHNNRAVITFFYKAVRPEAEVMDWFICSQSKHHRWNIDADQVRAYALGSEFNTRDSGSWWENTTLGQRRVNYVVFGSKACFATLICEDLARQDPCKPSIQSVGPNLIFALLMDSPQLAFRWPGRYAMGLTEDPGSSVLTVTSLGMVKRSNWQHNGTRQTIALWGQPKKIKEIDLPTGYEAVILGLRMNDVGIKRHTLDNREASHPSWDLESVTPIRR